MFTLNVKMPSIAAVSMSALAVAITLSVCAGLRRWNAPKIQGNRRPTFWGLYIDHTGRFIICQGTTVISRQRLVWDKTTREVTIAAWGPGVSVDEVFDIWQHIDDEEVLSNALNAIKPIFASASGQTLRHCTFIGPYTLNQEDIRLFTLALVSTGISDYVYHFTVHSAVINGLGLPLNSGDISNIAIIFPDGTSLIISPEETADSALRKMHAHETTVSALTSDMRKLEQIILLENELVKPSDYTPYIRQENLDIIARGASLWAIRRGGGAPFWMSLPPRISIAVLDSSEERVVHPVLGHSTSSGKAGQVIITTVADHQSSVEVQVLYNENLWTSLSLRGIPAAMAGEVDILFSVAVTTAGDYDEREVILQLVDLKSGIRVSRRVLLGQSGDAGTGGPTQIALSNTQSTARPISSDWDLFCMDRSLV
ncbi:hypothetical protein FPV67DRAFT_212241 [Lyophyllum atratum]|nr:hypothetical protein FPV67DRAFT_212241 [Lyophyllum atratum]